MKKLGVLAVILSLACIAGGAWAQSTSQDELVRRGGYGSTIPFTTIEQGVRVIRGHLPEPASGQPVIAKVAPPRIQPIGGGTFVDNETQRVVSCFRRRTTQVGIIRLICLNRRF